MTGSCRILAYPETATFGMTATVTGKTNERKPEKVTMAPNVGHEEGVGNLVTSCLDELTTPATAYRKASERMESDGYGEPDTTTAKRKPCTPHPGKIRKVTRSVRQEPSRMKLDSSSFDGDGRSAVEHQSGSKEDARIAGRANRRLWYHRRIPTVTVIFSRRSHATY